MLRNGELRLRFFSDVEGAGHLDEVVAQIPHPVSDGDPVSFLIEGWHDAYECQLTDLQAGGLCNSLNGGCHQGTVPVDVGGR